MTAYLTLATAAAQVSAYVLPTNIHVTPVNTSFYAYKSTGGGAGTEVSGQVQYTIDPIDRGTPLWFSVSTTGEFDRIVGVSSVNFAHSAIRLNVTQVSGSVNVAFSALNVGM